MKGQRGITLIALIITVIVMLILASVAITAVVGTEGLFDRSSKAATEYQSGVNKETQLLNTLLNEFEKYDFKYKN